MKLSVRFGFNELDNSYCIQDNEDILIYKLTCNYLFNNLLRKLFPEKSDYELFLMIPFEKIEPTKYIYDQPWDYPPINFKTQEDAQKCLEWLESLIIMHKLMGD